MSVSPVDVPGSERNPPESPNHSTDDFIMVNPVDPRFNEDTGLTVQNRRFCLATSNQGHETYVITSHAFERFRERVDDDTRRIFHALDFEDKQDALWAFHMILSLSKPSILKKVDRKRDQEVLTHRNWYFVLRRHSAIRIVTCLKGHSDYGTRRLK